LLNSHTTHWASAARRLAHSGPLGSPRLGRACPNREICQERRGGVAGHGSHVDETRSVFEQVALGDELPEFLTLPAYELL